MSLLRSGSAFSSDKSQRLVALVTGANKGIGREIAKLLADESSNITVILACRTDGKKIAQELGVDHSVYIDLADKTSIDQCAEYVKKEFGRLDILINNAAICFNDPTLYGTVAHTPFEKQADITIKTNYFGTRRLCQVVMPLLELSQQPRIINIASSAGRLAILRSQEKVDMFTDPNLQISQLDEHMKAFVSAVEDSVHADQGWPNTCYGMSKLGIIALTKILARDHPTMRVNSVDPGYCATDQNNNQGVRPAACGAVTPFLLATTNDAVSGLHWFDEQEIQW
jgi:carbonyl reductase 1